MYVTVCSHSAEEKLLYECMACTRFDSVFIFEYAICVDLKRFLFMFLAFLLCFHSITVHEKKKGDRKLTRSTETTLEMA